MPRIVLTLDLSPSNTGWAVADADDGPMPSPIEQRAGARRPQWYSGAERIGRPSCTVGELLHAFDKWLSDKIAVHAPYMVVMEAPIITAGSTSIDTARKQFAMAGHTELVCHRTKVRCYEQHNSTIKAYAGHGHATKPQMVAWAAERLGIRVKTHDEADAVWLMALTVATLCKAQKVQPKPSPSPAPAVF